MCYSFVIIRKIKFLFVFHHNKHSIIMWSFVKWQNAFQCWRFFIVSSSVKAHISITTCLNALIFAIYVENASFKCSVKFILNILIIVWLYFSWKNAICTKFWTGAVVRYYGNWKWCCSYIDCHKPINVGHLVGNKLYFTIIMTLFPIEGLSYSTPPLDKVNTRFLTSGQHNKINCLCMIKPHIVKKQCADFETKKTDVHCYILS